MVVKGACFSGWPPYILNVVINNRILTIYLYIIYGSNRVKCALSEYIWLYGVFMNGYTVEELFWLKFYNYPIYWMWL